jgi:HD domain-containing protein
MNQAGWAEEIARKLLEAPLPRRWAHTQGVAARARSLAPILGGDADLLEAAAWLHDIGYSPGLVDTGFHPLDGARYLREVAGADDLLCRLVAHHSGAVTEAEVRGLRGVLVREFPAPADDLADALTYSDMTTSPDGDHLTLRARLNEIVGRYGQGHLVTRSVMRSLPALVMTADRIEGRMSELTKCGAVAYP